MDGPTMQVFFRFDDITGLSSLDLEKQLFETFKNFGMVCSVGVVPMVTARDFEDPDATENVPLGQEKIVFLQSAVEQAVFDVLLHGFSHRALKRCSQPSEFSGRPADEQEDLLLEGRALLQKAINIKVSCFIPPWNTYDDNTLNILIKNGFIGISTNSDGPVKPGLSYVQYTTGIKGIREAVQLSRASKVGSSIIGVLLHPYDFKESGYDHAVISFKEMAAVLAWIAEQPDISVVSISQLVTDSVIDVGAERFKANKVGFWESVNPPFLNMLRKGQVYWPKKFALRHKAIRLILAMCWNLLVFQVGVAAAGGTSFALGYMGVPLPVFLIGVCAAIILLLGRGVRDKIIYFKPFLIMVLLAGVGMGVMIN
ncbi:MAG: DUF2334 domain-containing protein [Desulfobulbaceae bacterium]|nr:MAG: DUF2334 domain-containing protein [Desulfobulbaceae bacterium]